MRGPNNTVSPTATIRWTVTLWLLILAELGFLFFRAWFRARYFNGIPADGPFQLLNALDRIHAGQIPGRDFPVFHGLSVLYVHYPIYELLGHDLFASEFARQLLAPLGWISGTVALSYAITGSGRVALYALAMFSALACASGIESSKFPYVYVSAAVSQPGVSSIGLRWAYPAMCGAVFIWAFRSDTPSPAWGAIVGTLFGTALSWSFEQGAFAILAALGCLVVHCFVTRSKRHAFLTLIAFVGTLIPTAWLGFQILTSGHAQETLRYAFRTIPKLQGWSFGSPPNPSLAVNGMAPGVNGLPPGSTWGSYPVELFHEVVVVVTVSYLVATILLLYALVLAIGLRRHSNFGRSTLLGIGFLNLHVLFFMSSLSGYVWVNYLLPVVSAVLIAGISIGHAIIAQRKQTPVALAAPLVTIAVGALVLAYSNELRSFRRAFQATAATDSEISGVHISGIYKSLSPLIDRVRSEPSATVFSTWRGMLDIATNQPPHGRADHIIMTFDDREHQRFLETLAQGNFTFVHTVKPGYFPFEQWLQLSHWDFYQYVVEHYFVVAESDFSILWKRRPEPQILKLNACRRLLPDVNGRWLLPAESSPRFMVFKVEYGVHNALGSIPIINGLPRYLLEHRGLANSLPVSLNPYHTSAAWLVRSIGGTTAWITPRVYSLLPGARLTLASIETCDVTIPSDVKPEFAHLFLGQK